MNGTRTASAAPAQAPQLKGMSALVVEDDYLIATALVDLLRHEGALVTGPFGWEDQVVKAVAQKTLFDVALVDLNLHGKICFLALDLIIESRVPVVLLTGYSGEVIPEEYAHCLALPKPAGRMAIINALLSMRAIALSDGIPDASRDSEANSLPDSSSILANASSC